MAVSGGDVAESVPDTIRGALQARIDTLDENVKKRLRAASVFSGDVTAEVLETLLGEASHGARHPRRSRSPRGGAWCVGTYGSPTPCCEK